MLFWGMSFVWSSILLNYYQPVSIIFIRLIISSGFLFLMMLLLKKRQKINRKDYVLIFLSSVFNPFLYFLGENYGLKYSTSTVTAVIIATIPVFSPVVARMTMNERLSWYNITGIFVSFLGILIMLMNKEMNIMIDPKGVLFLSGAVVSALVYSVLLKKLSSDYSPLTLIAYQNMIGVFLFMPFFFFLEFKHFLKVTPHHNIVTSFLFLGILASSLAYVFYAKTVKVLGISKTNIFTNLIPVVTAIFSFFILSEYFTVLKVTGIIIVITGVIIAEVNLQKRRS
jgi:drug/metabolite transporter (DMT)-like permease